MLYVSLFRSTVCSLRNGVTYVGRGRSKAEISLSVKTENQAESGIIRYSAETESELLLRFCILNKLD